MPYGNVASLLSSLSHLTLTYTLSNHIFNCNFRLVPTAPVWFPNLSKSLLWRRVSLYLSPFLCLFVFSPPPLSWRCSSREPVIKIWPLTGGEVEEGVASIFKSSLELTHYWSTSHCVLKKLVHRVNNGMFSSHFFSLSLPVFVKYTLVFWSGVLF